MQIIDRAVMADGTKIQLEDWHSENSEKYPDLHGYTIGAYPIAKNTKFGNHTDKNGDMLPLTENEVLMVCAKIYTALNAKPAPKCKPVPPRTLRDDSETPIKVIINAANGEAKRL